MTAEWMASDESSSKTAGGLRKRFTDALYRLFNVGFLTASWLRGRGAVLLSSSEAFKKGDEYGRITQRNEYCWLEAN